MDTSTRNETTEPFPVLSPIASSAEASQVGTNNEPASITIPRAQTFPEIGSPKEQQQQTLQNVSRSETTTAGRARRTRGSSLLHTIANSNPPLGMWQATGELGSKAPTLPEIRNGSFSNSGWSHEGQLERRKQDPFDIHRRRLSRTSSFSADTGRTRSTKGTITERTDAYRPGPTVPEEGVLPSDTTTGAEKGQETNIQQNTPHVKATTQPSKHEKQTEALTTSASVTSSTRGPDETGTYPNGYRFPKKHTWTQSMAIGVKAFWKFFLTIPGFLITIYGLNVVAWGAMIFFVLIPGATPAMCHPDCEDINSPRKIWIEIDSQILNALFCVTGFGLLPWRLRDFYFLARWRIWGKQDAHRRLAGIYRGWYRLPGSQNLPDGMSPPISEEKLKKQKGNKSTVVDEEAIVPYTAEELSALENNPAVPLPPSAMPDAPLTGIRAAPTKSWNLDIIIWMYILNSAFQACLAGFMWGMNRYNRPSWATGFFITIGCVTGIIAGIVVFVEGSKIKKAEGIPIKEYDVLESVDDFQQRRAKEEEKERKKAERKEKKVIKIDKIKGRSES